MTAQALIDLLADYAPTAEVEISIDSFIKGEPESFMECQIVRVEQANGRAFLVGERRNDL